MKTYVIECPCCGRKIELQIAKNGEITVLFLCDNGIELGVIDSVIPDLMEGGVNEKDE